MKRPRRRISNIDKGKLTPFGSRVLSRILARKLDIVAQPSEAEARRYLYGSVTEGIIRASSVPILLVVPPA